MNESQLIEHEEEKERNERIRMIAVSLYKDERKTLSPKEIYSNELLEVTLLKSYPKDEVRDIINHIRCLSISDYEHCADSPYEYSIENKYDPKFMDKFTVDREGSIYRVITADLTKELFRDEKRVIQKPNNKLLYKLWKDIFCDGDIEEFLDYIYKGLKR